MPQVVWSVEPLTERRAGEADCEQEHAHVEGHSCSPDQQESRNECAAAAQHATPGKGGGQEPQRRLHAHQCGPGPEEVVAHDVAPENCDEDDDQGRCEAADQHRDRARVASRESARLPISCRTGRIYADDVSAAEVVQLLRERRVVLETGLSEAELARAERRYGVRFAQDHRELLALALPVGDRWFNWRARADEHVRRAVRWPFEGVLFDVENNVFWPTSWGERPDSVAARFKIVKRQVNTWPQLVPLYGHRYLPAAPSGPGAPVFSVHQTDVVIYGSNLLDYAAREFGATWSLPIADVETCGLEPWSLLAFEEDVP
jgi:hypothetical protein